MMIRYDPAALGTQPVYIGLYLLKPPWTSVPDEAFRDIIPKRVASMCFISRN